ncbi:MAG: SCO family protein, partial [Pseudomonadota bacterium]
PMANKLLLGGGAVAGCAAAALAVTAMVATSDPFAPCIDTRMAEAIGGPFELTDENGQRVTDTEVFSKPSLIYFGYTFCPDVCPVDNVRNAEVAEILEAKGHELQPVFVSVDPARDTPEVLAEFTDYFHPDMLGLTGSVDDLASVTSDYKVYFSAHEPEEGDDFYLVDHSTFSFLVLPEHGAIDLVRRDEAPDVVAERAACIIERAA